MDSGDNKYQLVNGDSNYLMVVNFTKTEFSWKMWDIWADEP